MAATKSFVAMLAEMIMLSFTLADKADEGQKVLESSAVVVEEILQTAGRYSGFGEADLSGGAYFLFGAGFVVSSGDGGGFED